MVFLWGDIAVESRRTMGGVMSEFLIISGIIIAITASPIWLGFIGAGMAFAGLITLEK